MSHELTMNRVTGLIEMGYASGVDRWHGLGNEWLDTDTQEEKIEKSGMSWTAKRSRVRYGEGPAQRTINDKHVLFRSDTKDPLGIVGEGYQIVQPRESIEFFQDLAATGNYVLKTAGTLYGGKKFWATASIGQEDSIVGVDNMEGFLLFTSSFEGGSTIVTDTTICTVCDNTMRAALSQNDRNEIRVSHRSKFDASTVKAQMGLATGRFEMMIEAARQLAKVRMSEQPAKDFISKVLIEVADLSAKRIEEGKSDGFNKVLALFSGEGKGSQLPGRAGTAWGLVNAFTEYVDHHAPAKNAENRMENAMWGDGDKLKTVVIERALAL